MNYQVVPNSEIAEKLSGLSGWSVVGQELSKSFESKSYSQGVLFAVAVSHLAERLNHHPDVLISYGSVRVSLTTHDVGNGLTNMDFELARQIDSLT